jgi:hypothetical protein
MDEASGALQMFFLDAMRFLRVRGTMII